MIPKIIHYCWFGGNSLNDLAKKCIESWKKHCPDYKIIEWNESNFDINSNTYVKEAYGAKKWAFVTDYVRLYALCNFGGIYMDTDVELLKKPDSFLKHAAFSGFESNKEITTGIMASEKNGEWVKYLLSYYDNKHFLLPDGKPDLTTNVTAITNMTCWKYKIQPNNTFQQIDGVLALYPKDYFCPKNYETGEIVLTENTVCIHHFNASWHSEESRKEHEYYVSLVNKYGKKRADKKRIWHNRAKRLKAIFVQEGFLKGVPIYLHKAIVLFEKKIQPVYYQLRISKSKKILRNLYNTHKGERCFVIGNGPSLTAVDLDKLKSEICFGTNRIYHIFDQTQWRPDYYCAQDYNILIQDGKNISRYKYRKKFIPIIKGLCYKKIKKAVWVNLISKDFYPDLPEFSKDISVSLTDGYTVTYSCIQIAAYMGFKEIYLLGVDHNYSVEKAPDGRIISHGAKKDHFSDDDKVANIPEVFKSALSYEAAEKYAKTHGIKIYNATRGGKLETFERVDFDTIVARRIEK